MFGIFGLNLIDAYLTLDYIRRGGTEANPFMDALLRASHHYFLYEKCIVVAICLLVLVVHRTFPLARFGLWGLLVVYGLLFFYHVYLQVMVRTAI